MTRILFLALVLSTLACHHEKPAKEYPVSGVIVRVDLPAKSITLNAAKIEGWMDAMTMDYPVHDPKLLDGLKPGDHITATVHVPEDLSYWLDNIKNTP